MKSIGKILTIAILIWTALSIPCSCLSIEGGNSVSVSNAFAEGNQIATSASGDSSTLLKDITMENSAGDSVHLYAVGDFIGPIKYKNNFKVTSDHVYGTETLKGVGDMIKVLARATNAEGMFAETCAVVASASSENENYIDYSNEAWASKEIVWASQETFATGPDALITTHAFTSNLIGVDPSYITAKIDPVQRVELEAEKTTDGPELIPDIIIGRAFGQSAILNQKVSNTGDFAEIKAFYIYPKDTTCNVEMIVSSISSEYANEVVQFDWPKQKGLMYESNQMTSFSDSYAP